MINYWRRLKGVARDAPHTHTHYLVVGGQYSIVAQMRSVQTVEEDILSLASCIEIVDVITCSALCCRLC